MYVSEDEIGQDNYDKVVDSLKKSALYDYVNKLPEKELTRVGERGMKLSGGQRQRLAFARAIYNNPELIVMDEATSSLDQETEREILTSLETIKNKTLVVIHTNLKPFYQWTKLFILKMVKSSFLDKKMII